MRMRCEIPRRPPLKNGGFLGMTCILGLSHKLRGAAAGDGGSCNSELTTPCPRLIKGGSPFVPVEPPLNIRPEFLQFKGDCISP